MPLSHPPARGIRGPSHTGILVISVAQHEPHSLPENEASVPPPSQAIIDIPVSLLNAAELAVGIFLGVPVLMVLTLLLLFAFEAAFGAAARTGPLVGVRMAIILLPLIFISRFQTRAETARLRQLLEVIPAVSPAAFVRRALPDCHLFCGGGGVAALARVLAADGRAGEIFRAGREAEFTPVEPAAFTFEPRKLSEREIASDDLLASLVDNDRRAEAATPPDATRTAKRTKPSRPRSAASTFALPVAAGILVLAGYLYGIWSRADLSFLVLALAYACGVRALTPEWFVVPGGVAAKSTYNSKVTYLRPADSVLVLRQRSRRGWHVAISDGERVARRALTNLEVQVLLACWLSPIEAPPHERIRQALVSDEQPHDGTRDS